MEQNIFDNLRRELEKKNLTKEEKTRLIQKAGEEYNKQVDRELNRYLTKQYVGAALEIGSAALPLGASKTVGTAASKIAPILEKSIGKKLTKDITTSAISGAIGSSIYGVGRGLMDDKNILQTSLEDAVSGLGAGAILGAATSNLQRMLQEKNFQSYKNPEVLKKVGKKNATKEIKKYYSDYIQGIVDSDSDIGEYKFVKNGIKETINQKFNKALDVASIRKDMKNAKYMGPEPLAHARKQSDQTVQFHRFRQGDTDYIFRELDSGKINYHIAKPVVSDVKNPEKANTLLGQGLLQGSGNLPLTKIISDYLENRNPAKWLNSQITTNIIGATHQYDEKFIEALNKFEYEMSEDALPGVIKGGVSEYDYPEKIYTLEEFENMSAEDYDKNKYEIHEQIGKIGLPTERGVASMKKENNQQPFGDTDKENGRWITRNGVHIFIKDEK